jgi:hypothetical protein
MRLENFIKLVGGELLTCPTITSFENIVLSARRAKRGDLFILQHHDDLPTVLESGVYALLCEKRPSLIDEEIAYILVDAIKPALIRLLRYHLALTKASYYGTSFLEYHILKQIATDNRLRFVRNTVASLFDAINDLSNDAVLFSCDKELIETLSAESYETLKDSTMERAPLHATLLSSSFIYHDRFFSHINIPPFMLPALYRSLELLDTLQAPYSIDRFPLPGIFQPTYIDHHFVKKEFGKSAKVVIIDAIENMERSLPYFLQSTSWAKRIIFLPHTYEKSYAKPNTIYYYKDKKEILSLKGILFDFALLYMAREDADILFQTKIEVPTLF